MNEFKITVEAPGLEQAMNNLAGALRNGGINAQPVTIAPAAPVNAPQAPAAPVNAPQAPAAPMQPQAPVQAPAAPVGNPAPAPAPAPVQVPMAAPQGAPAPVQMPQGAPVQMPQATQAPATGVTLDAIINAGAGLVERGMMAQVVALLGKYGLQAVNQLQPPQYEPFAAELRALGANL